MSFPCLRDLESNIKGCDSAIESVIGSYATVESEERLTFMLDALAELRAMRICLDQWIAEERKARGETEGGAS